MGAPKKNNKLVRNDECTPSTTESGIVHFIVHFSQLVLYFAHLWYVYTVIDSSEELTRLLERDTFGGRWTFLTVINEAMVTVYVLTACVTDVLPIKLLKQRISSVTDFVFTAIVFPVSLFVGIIFWSLFYYNHECIFPLMLDQYIPSIVMHGQHTLPLVAVLAETLLVSHKYILPTAHSYSNNDALWLFILCLVSAGLMLRKSTSSNFC